MSVGRGVVGAPRLAPWLAAPLVLLLVIPVVMLLVRNSPSELAAALRSPEVLEAVWLSLATSAAALLIALALGTPLAYWLARSRSRVAAVAEVFVDLPIVLPPAVAGVGLLLALGRNGLLGSWLERVGLEVAFTPAAVVIAQVFVASPYSVRAARAGFASIPAEVRESAVLDGASGWRLFADVLAPAAGPSLLAGAAMCWSRALGEFGATIIFAGNFPGRTQTMPLAIYIGIQNSLDRALALSTILILLSLVLLAAVRLTGWKSPVERP